MEEKKRNFRETVLFLFVGAMSGLILAMVASDALKVREYKGQIAHLQQQLAMTQEKLASCGK